MPAWWGVGELVCVGPPRTIHSFPRSEDYLIFTVPRSYVWEISLLTYSSGTEKRTKHAQEENPPSGTKAEAEVGIRGPPRLRFVYAAHPIVPARRTRGSCRYEPGHTKSMSARVSREYIFWVYTRTRGIFRRVPHTHTRRMGRPKILATSDHQGYP